MREPARGTMKKEGGDVEPLFDGLGAAGGLTNSPSPQRGSRRTKAAEIYEKSHLLTQRREKKRKYFILVKRFLISALEISWPIDRVAYVSTQWRGVLTTSEDLRAFEFASATTGDAPQWCRQYKGESRYETETVARPCYRQALGGRGEDRWGNHHP
jgi:hypothetical protein